MPTNPLIRKAIADLIGSLTAPDRELVDGITLAARDAIPGAEYASIVIVRDDGSVESLAPTDDVVVTVDKLQGELGEGPCYDAALAGRVFVSEDLAHDSRWPLYGPRAVEFGIAAQMGVDLQHPDGGRAALNFYATKPWVFVNDLETADLFASHASLALGYASAAGQGLRGRRIVGLALGILMERYQIDEDKATQLLIETSSASHVALSEVAAEILAGVNQRSS